MKIAISYKMPSSKSGASYIFDDAPHRAQESYIYERLKYHKQKLYVLIWVFGGLPSGGPQVEATK
jgi:hypothetical protein